MSAGTARVPPPESPGPRLEEAAGPPLPDRRQSYRRVLSNRPFFHLWLAQFVSQSGDYVFQVALFWLALSLTHSAFAVGVVVASSILPGVLLGPILGVYIDRWNRRRTLIVTEVVLGALVAALSVVVLRGLTDLAELTAFVLMLGGGATLIRVTTNAYVPSVVPVSDLPSANGLLSVGGSLNQIVGLSVGGAVVALLGVTIPIQYDALSFFVAAGVLIASPVAGPGLPPEARSSRAGFVEEFREGLRFIRSHRFLLEIIAISVFVNFFGNGIFALYAPYAAFVLQGGAAEYGLLGAASAAGILLGALAMGKVNLHRTGGRYVFVGGAAVGVTMLGLGLVRVLPLALAIIFAMGLALAVTNVPISVVIQAKTPGRILGRVGATLSALVLAAGPAGPIFAGWLAVRTSVADVFVLAGSMVVAVFVVSAATMRSLRSTGSAVS